MAVSNCEKWERGGDCSFNSWYFYLASTSVWVLTICPLLWKAIRRGWKNPGGATTWCIVLTTISAMLSFMDDFLYLVHGQKHAGLYHLHMLTFIGSIFLVFALSIFAGLWCNVATTLHSRVIHPLLPSRTLQLIRYGYKIIAVFHVPFACLKAIADVKEELGLGMIRRDEISLIWTLWSFVSSFSSLTLFACLMLHVTVNLGEAPDAHGFRAVTWVNFVEQILYDVSLGAIALLFYWGDAYNKYGSFQAAYAVLYFLLYWSMHAQVLVFFSVVEKDDPLYSKVNDVVGSSAPVEDMSRQTRMQKSALDDISFAWEGGTDFNTLMEQTKRGIRASAQGDFKIHDLKTRSSRSPEQSPTAHVLFAEEDYGSFPHGCFMESEEDDTCYVYRDKSFGKLDSCQDDASVTLSTAESTNHSQFGSSNHTANWQSSEEDEAQCVILDIDGNTKVLPSPAGSAPPGFDEDDLDEGDVEVPVHSGMETVAFQEDVTKQEIHMDI